MREEQESRQRRRLLSDQPLSRLFPNLVTIAGLCCGLSAIRFALAERWEFAVAFIFAAAIIDGMDGRIARMLGATSIFGAQLDSLSDFLCFGVAPVMVMYLWQLNEIKGIGWALVLFYTVCCALRLARFNTGILTESLQQWQKKFFVGVPSPAGGCLCLWPLIISLQFNQEFKLPAAVTAVHVLAVAVLMASRVPTFAAKNVRIKPDLILPFTVTATFMLVLFIIEPWWVASLLSAIYLGMIPIGIGHYRKLQRKHAGHAPATVIRGESSSAES